MYWDNTCLPYIELYNSNHKFVESFSKLLHDYVNAVFFPPKRKM